ncbi:diguanylate cyclase domain-containing protein [Halomonas mongoliensis]|uniref:diguanylate cyclase domain-containing protein n=1 Tax=Halomonas mongoliensis TaxID=321265 RepID=UPI00403B20C1
MSSASPSRSAHFIRRMHRRVRTLAALGILTTALLAGLATALPFYHSARSGIEHIYQLSLEAHAESLHHQFRHYQEVTRQLAGRTEIRRRLEEYARGEISLEAVSAYSTPRLADSMAQASQIAGLLRQGPDHETIARLGQVPPNPEPALASPEGYPCRFHQMPQGKVLIQGCAPILDASGEVIGRDLVLFHADVLQELLSGSYRFGNDTPIRLRNLSSGQELMLDAGTLALTDIASPTAEDGITRVPLAADLGDHGWQLLVEVPTHHFHDEAIRLLAWPALAMLLLALGGTWIISRALHPLLTRVDQQTRQLERSREELLLAASVFRSAQEAIAITDPEHRIIDVNPAFAAHLGYSRQALEDCPITQLLAWQDDSEERLREGRSRLEQEDTWQGDVRYRRANGDTLVALQTISTVRSDSGELLRYIHIFNDVTEQKAAEEAVRHQALHDKLTGLPNRTQLERHLQRALHQAGSTKGQLAVLFLDLDHFKEVNDTLGHQAGDLLLQSVTQRLKANLRSNDLLARLGGDEFVVAVDPVQDAQDAIRVARKIIDALTTPFTINGTEVTIGVSVGVALYPADGGSADDLLKAADAAMYRAKDAGRNTWRLYDRALDEALSGSASR